MNRDRRTHYVYINNKTGEEFTLEALQNKYGYGFGDNRLWAIIESLYRTEERHTDGESADIIFDPDEEEVNSG